MANIFKAKTLVGRTGLFSHEVIAPNLVYNTGNQIIYGDKSFYSDTKTLISGNFEIIPDYNLNGDGESLVNISSKNLYVDNQYIIYADDTFSGKKYVAADLTDEPYLDLGNLNIAPSPALRIFTNIYESASQPISEYKNHTILNSGNIYVYRGNMYLESGKIEWNPYLSSLVPQPIGPPIYTTNLYPISPFALKSDTYAFIVASGTGIFKELYANNLVYNTGNQTILGNKTFTSGNFIIENASDTNQITPYYTRIYSNDFGIYNPNADTIFEILSPIGSDDVTNFYSQGSKIIEITGGKINVISQLADIRSNANIYARNLVYNTGNQNISGNKTFVNNIEVQGTGIFNSVDLSNISEFQFSGVTMNLVDTNVYVSGGWIYISGNPVLTGAQSISTINLNNIVYTTGNQTIEGIKDFNNIINVSGVKFDVLTTTQTPAHQEGLLYYSDDNKTLNLDLDVANLKLLVGQENIIRAKNLTSTTMSPGTVVYINGAQGNTPLVERSIATGDSTSARTLGVAAHSINNNSKGYFTTFGLVEGINTSAYSVGQTLYLSHEVSGGLTGVKPQAPNHIVRIGNVIDQGANGSIFVDILNGFEIDELHDVRIVNQQNKDGIVYNSTSGLWLNTPVALANEVVYITGNQNISGDKNFLDKLIAKTGFFGENNNLVGSFSAMAGGANNIVSGDYNFLGGGDNNIVNNSCYSFIGGGLSNCACADWTSIVGGKNNCVLFYSSTIGGGDNNTVSGCYSSVLGGCCNFIGGALSNIAGGSNNRVLRNFSNINGGENNTTSGFNSFIGGGLLNCAFGDYSASVGGCSNRAMGTFNFIGAGRFNCSNGCYSSTVGGHLNCAIGNYNFVGGGENNCAVIGTNASVIGGNFNCATGTYSFVGGGLQNKARGCYSSTIGGFNNVVECLAFESTIGGGRGNAISAGDSFIGAGITNTIGAGACAGFIGGGSSNLLGGNNVGGYMATIGGGSSNQASGERSAILGGQSNLVFGECSAIIGGQGNINCGRTSIIGGGSNNFIVGPSNNSINSFIGGGTSNIIYRAGSSIPGGQANIISGIYSATLGGFGNEIYSEYSFVIGGRRSCILRNHDGAAILGDGQNREHTSSGCHSLVIDFASGIYLAKPQIYGDINFNSNVNAVNLTVSGNPTLTGIDLSNYATKSLAIAYSIAL